MISRFKKIKCLILLFISCLFFITYLIFYGTLGYADEGTAISADELTYDSAAKTFNAKGHVRIERGDILIDADEISYNEQTSDLIASGNILYNDTDVLIETKRAEINLETKSGTIYDVKILFKRGNYRLIAEKVTKTGDNFYVSPEANFTTCDPPSPAWCFKGRDLHAAIGDTLTAKQVVFRIKNIPVLYTPVLWAPILNERKTGLLFPYLGYSDARGFQITAPFYWAFAENQDVSLIADEYTKRGFGKGVEYRYVFPDNIRGRWWGYHIQDRELGKNFFELRAQHDQRSTSTIGGYIDVNAVNEKEFFREFKTDLQARTNRFLESTGEIAIPFVNSRVYLLSQYWIDLKENTQDPLQRLPEAGYVLNPTTVGPFLISGSASIANFWREKGSYGQRLDIMPKITYAFGDDVTFLQSFVLRETAYSLHGNESNSPHREAFEYHISGHTRLLRKYASFSHALEPSVSYTLVINSENSLPLFDAAELSKKISTIELSLLNRIMSERGELLVFRISQAFDSFEGDRPFLPLSLDVGIRHPLTLRLGATYNVHSGEMEIVKSDCAVKIADITLSAGQRYNSPNDINTYVAGVSFRPLSPIAINGNIWYDAEQRETREIGMNVTYMSQCWGINLGFIKRPDDFSVSFLFELKGITKALKI